MDDAELSALLRQPDPPAREALRRAARADQRERDELAQRLMPEPGSQDAADVIDMLTLEGDRRARRAQLRRTILTVGDAIIGGIVTGTFTLVAVALTLRHQTNRAREAAAARRRTAKATRLRAAYLEVVSAANEAYGRASVLALATAAANEPDAQEMFFKHLEQATKDISNASASLMLETDADRLVLDAFDALGEAHLRYMLRIGQAERKGTPLQEDEFLNLIHPVQELAQEVARLARERLAELEAPSAESGRR